MPVYEYVCHGCGEPHTEVKSITEYGKDGPRVGCPKCKARKLERVYNGYGGFQLSGGDWPSKAMKRVGR